jgi:hypothetical protein
MVLGETTSMDSLNHASGAPRTSAGGSLAGELFGDSIFSAPRTFSSGQDGLVSRPASKYEVLDKRVATEPGNRVSHPVLSSHATELTTHIASGRPSSPSPPAKANVNAPLLFTRTPSPPAQPTSRLSLQDTQRPRPSISGPPTSTPSISTPMSCTQQHPQPPRHLGQRAQPRGILPPRQALRPR